MKRKKIVAMLLAGGQGSRLGVLTSTTAKPAVPFGGKYRIIDFPLSNCSNSEIDTVGVMTQYEPLALNSYLGNGQPWDLDRNSGGVFVLPPYISGDHGKWYSGTANAVYQNLKFLEQYNPEYVLILSGDHIYKMDYSLMLKFHEEKQADATVAVIRVPINEANRFGIMNTDDNSRILQFEEKPKAPKSDLASMGVYIFNYKKLKAYLNIDAEDKDSENDFGKNVIPLMLKNSCRMFAFSFDGYWKDVGTIKSLYDANMDLLTNPPKLQLNDITWRIYGRNPILPPHYASGDAEISHSLVTEGCEVYGTVKHSVLFAGVKVEKGTVIEDSILMPYSVIGADTQIKKAIVGENTVVGCNCLIGVEVSDSIDNSLTGDITLIANDMNVSNRASIPKGKVVRKKEDIV
ncbi:MAG: glucose-1-phosphate adenylyltransferase [Clostridiales bacterium]|nr:glucose-1-phosphate adenylyltransferase [Clostridiales bacterium]